MREAVPLGSLFFLLPFGGPLASLRAIGTCQFLGITCPLTTAVLPGAWPSIPGLMPLAWLPAPLMPSSTWGPGKAGYRHAERVERGLLDSGQRLCELALAPDFEHHHRCKFGHHHERCWLLGGLLVPPHQRLARRLHVDP